MKKRRFSDREGWRTEREGTENAGLVSRPTTSGPAPARARPATATSSAHLEYEKNAMSRLSSIGQQPSHRPLGVIVAENGFLPGRENRTVTSGSTAGLVRRRPVACVGLTPKQRERHARHHAQGHHGGRQQQPRHARAM